MPTCFGKSTNACYATSKLTEVGQTSASYEISQLQAVLGTDAVSQPATATEAVASGTKAEESGIWVRIVVCHGGVLGSPHRHVDLLRAVVMLGRFQPVCILDLLIV